MENIPFLSIIIFLPLVGSILSILLRKRSPDQVHQLGIVCSLLTFLFVLLSWYKGIGGGFSQVEERIWIPSVQAAYRVGVDGISFPLVFLTALLFLVSLIYISNNKTNPPAYVSLVLLMETACLGVFLSLDLLLFYVFFEVTLVGMYFIIAGWGHENKQKAAITFFIYTLVGSLVLLLALIGLYLYSDVQTFDIRQLTDHPSITGLPATLVFWGFFLAFAIKSPLFPFHSWLPLAHTEAPSAGSVLLAGVLLKLGGYGFIRFAFEMVPDAFQQNAKIVMVFAVISALYGAFLALAQTDIKRMVAYTSINHMGYLTLGVASASVAGAMGKNQALDGAVLQMVSHGVVTGALFLLVGSLQDRTQTRQMNRMQGILQQAPSLGWLFILCAFASFGLPGLAHFPAEFQIFLGSFSVYPVAVGITIIGLVITTGLYLRAIYQVFMGKPIGDSGQMPDLNRRERWAIIPLIVIILMLGIFPQTFLNLIHKTIEGLGL